VNKRKKKQLKHINKVKHNKINVLFYMAKKHKAYEFQEDGKKFVLLTEEYYKQLQEEKDELLKKIQENLELLT
jgi:hypothetical protein